MEVFSEGGYSVLSIDTYQGEDENAYNRIVWATCGESGHGAEDAIRMEMGTKGGESQCRSTRAGRANAEGEQ